MKTTFKRVLSVVLCILMVFGTATVAFAANVPSVTHGARYFQTTTDAQNAKIALDKIDELLKDANIIFDLKKETKNIIDFTIDLRDVNGLCKAIDDIKGIMNNPIVWATAKTLLGDIRDVNLNGWQENMKRPKDDVLIFNELIELLNANSTALSKIVKGNFSLGVGDNFININEKIGPDGVYGLLKGLLVGVMYDDENSKEYKEAYAKKLDNFLFEDLVAKKLGGADGALPGFKMNGESTVDSLLLSIFKSCYDKYLVPLVQGLSSDMIQPNGNPALEKVKEVVNLDGSKFTSSTVKIDLNKKFVDQINNILGDIFKFFLPGFNDWKAGGINLVGSNLTALYRWAAKQFGIVTNDNDTSAALAVKIINYILTNINDESVNGYIEGINDSMTFENLIITVLKNVCIQQEMPYANNGKITYEGILGDMLAWAMRRFIDIGYTGGQGKSVWTVLNDIANVYLFDKGFAKAFNLNVKKTDSIFVKVDKLIDTTKIFNGLTPAENYKSEKFIKDLLDAAFKFDIEKVVNMTAVTFLNDFGQKRAVKVIYDAIYNFLKNWFGKEIIVAYKDPTPLDNAIQNSSLKTTVQNLLSGLESKKSAILPTALYIAALAINGNVPAESVDLGKAPYNSGATTVPEQINVTIEGKKYTLKRNTDYDVSNISGTFDFGDKATATFKFFGLVKGEYTADYTIGTGHIPSLKASAVTTTTATLSWGTVKGATKYVVIDPSGNELNLGTDLKTSLTGLTAGKQYTYKVQAISGTNVLLAESTVTFVTIPTTVTGVKASAITSNSLTLSWTKVANATSYDVQFSADGKTSTTKTVNTNSINITGLAANKQYQFKVRAVVKGSAATAYGAYSGVIKATTLLATPTGLKTSSPTKSSIKLTWNKVAGATSYTVWYSGKTKTVTTNSLTFTGLKANTEYQFKVMANSKTNKSGYSAVLKAKTLLADSKGLKASAIKDKSMTLTWTKIAGAAGYQVSYSTDGKKWTNKTTTANTLNLTGLAANKAYQIKVRAYTKYGSTTLYGAYSPVIKATTKLASVKNFKIKSANASSIKLSWSKVTGATGYKVEYSTDGKKWTAKKTTGTSLTLSKLSAKKAYQVRISAYSKTNTSAVSSVLKGTTAPSGKVTGVKISSATSKTLKVSWKKVAGATGYKVYYSLDGKKWSTTTTSSTSVTLKKLSSNKTYRVKVSALKKAAAVTAEGTASAVVKGTTKVAAVTGLKSAKTTKNSIKLSWKKVSGASGYVVYKLNGKKWTKIATIKKGATVTYTDKNLKRNTNYQYKVAAYKTVSKKNVQGDFSSVLKVKTKLF